MLPTKSIFLLALFAAVMLWPSCGNDDPVDPADAAFLGVFVSGVHTTSGKVSIDQEETTMTFTDFKTDSGPDLNIYLAASNTNVTSDYIDLGNIKGVDGDYTYSLPENVDYMHYKYVVVWCVAFHVNFGYAELVKQ